MISNSFIFIIIELTVQFSKDAYTGSERSGMIPVTLVLGGGISLNKITVTVTPSDQSPVSAEGKKACNYPIVLVNWLMLLLGNSVDYTSTPIDATFAANTTSTTINVPVSKDNIAEESETFNLTLTIPPSLSSQVIPGKITKAVGVITDDTSKIV